MTNSMKQTVIKNPTWWKRRTALERGLTVIAVTGVLLCIALAISIAVLVSNSKSHETMTGTMEAFQGQRNIMKPTIIDAPYDDICMSEVCLDEALKVIKNMDSEVEPCDDFYKFACGNFIKKTTIPEDKVSVNAFSVISDKVQDQLKESILSINLANKPVKPLKLVRHLYNVCMNKTAIEEKGLNPLLNKLKILGGWPVLEGDSWDNSSFSWIDSVYKFRDAGYSTDYFIDFSIGIDLKNSTKRVLDLDQPSLGLSREYFVKGLKDKIVNAYYEYMVDIAVILGAEKSKAKSELYESLQFEISLANITLPLEKRRNATELYNPMTIKKLSEKYQSIPWKTYFNRLLAPVVQVDDDEIVIVNEPNFIIEFEKLIKKTPTRVLANYVMWRAASTSITVLNDEIRNRQLQYYTVVSGKTEREYRWKECVSTVSYSLSLSVGALYIKKYFNEDAKRTAVEMVNDIRFEFNKILEKVEWMDDVTRKSALEKAKSMSTHIAYPDELLDDKKLEEFYDNLELNGDNYLENILNLTLFQTNYSFSKLRKPVNKSDWISHGRPAVVNAFYSSIENSIQFPAAILQGTFFNNDRPKYMNYGSIGFVIGHEITHGFDDQGRQFDKEGNLVDWWAPSTKEKYLEKAECIINQYGNYTVKEVGMNLNGINTQGENIADNGGIKEAYLAYQNWLSRNKEEQRLPGLAKYNSKQMFWISAANTWCSVYRPEALRIRITTGYHSPGEFRILGPLSNMKEFSDDFGCPVGSKMRPNNTCTVW